MFTGKQTKTFTFSERAFNRAFQFDEGPKSMTPVKDQNRLVLKSKKRQRKIQRAHSQIEWSWRPRSKDCCGGLLASKSEWGFGKRKDERNKTNTKPGTIPACGRHFVKN